jgi:hypothetical protein
MKKIKYSEKDMAALISEVEAQFSTRVAKAAQEKTDLKKSEAVAQPVDEKPVIEAAPQEQGFDYDESDIAEMNAMYGSMTKAEAEAHFESLKKALSKEDEKPAVKAEETTISKSEVKEATAPTSDETAILKSEIESLKSEKEKLEKSFTDLTAKLTEFFKGNKAPKQKAITKLEYVAKSEDEQKTETKNTEDVSKLDKSEVSKRLTAKIRSGKLEKAEREKINEFYQSGSKNIESIRHLLTGGN